jgi:hypothetical protein
MCSQFKSGRGDYTFILKLESDLLHWDLPAFGIASEQGKLGSSRYNKKLGSSYSSMGLSGEGIDGDRANGRTLALAFTTKQISINRALNKASTIYS